MPKYHSILCAASCIYRITRASQCVCSYRKSMALIQQVNGQATETFASDRNLGCSYLADSNTRHKVTIHLARTSIRAEQLNESKSQGCQSGLDSGCLFMAFPSIGCSPSEELARSDCKSAICIYRNLCCFHWSF